MSFLCPHCQKSYSHHSSRYRHIKRDHPLPEAHSESSSESSNSQSTRDNPPSEADSESSNCQSTPDTGDENVAAENPSPKSDDSSNQSPIRDIPPNLKKYKRLFKTMCFCAPPGRAKILRYAKGGLIKAIC